MVHFLAALLGSLSFLSQEPLLALASWAALYLSYLLFWRKNEPKVIFSGMFFFWLTIPIKLFYADFYNLFYDKLSISPNIITTTYSSLVGYVVFCLGLYIGTRSMKVPDLDTVIEDVSKEYNIDRVLQVYVISILITILLKGILFAIPGLSQLFHSFLKIKLALVFLLVFVSFVKNERLLLVFVLFSIEVILSFFSIFSSFKDILITILVSLTVFNLAKNRKLLINFFVIGSLCAYLFIIWQAVKGDYRHYITGGKKSQKIVVAQNDALKKLFTLINSANLSNPLLWYQTVDRMSYIEFYSQATDNVPKHIPYTAGNILEDNVLHIIRPRILFPNKKEIDDSELVNRYCTQKVSGASKGTTFSLGFMAESYIDFGPYFMFIPVFLYALFMGFIYKRIFLESINMLWGYTMITPLWVNINCNGIAGTKVLSFLIMYYIGFYLFKKFLMIPIDKFIRSN